MYEERDFYSEITCGHITHICVFGRLSICVTKKTLTTICSNVYSPQHTLKVNIFPLVTMKIIAGYVANKILKEYFLLVCENTHSYYYIIISLLFTGFVYRYRKQNERQGMFACCDSHIPTAKKK